MSHTKPADSNKRVAVMDLGTNTFHLLIAEGNVNGFKEILHLHEGVKLGEGGINKGLIQPEAFERGLAAMQSFSKHIHSNQVVEIRAIATSALRNAANGNDFISQVKEQTGISITIINGDEEAGYIYSGIKSSGCLNDDNALIVDIGGGSVEFIISNDQYIWWKQSFEIGAARLMDKFHQTDPIPAKSISGLNHYMGQQLAPLFKAAAVYQPGSLIGSSGAFESFAEVIELEKGNSFDLKKTPNYTFKNNELLQLIERLAASSHQERAATKGIIPVRVDMIVPAALITHYIIQKLYLKKVVMSTYSLKEGVLAEMLRY